VPPATGKSAAQVREQLMDVLAPVVAATGHDLEDVAVSIAGRRTLLRIIVDADGGVDLDAVADVSRAVSDRLDDEAPGGAAFAGPYVLEVSSPGIDRPLIEPRHWRRATGRLVQVNVEDEQLLGRVVAADADGVTLDLGDTGGRREVRWPDLGPGRVQVEFHRAGAEEE
jgi:ribosome maturation factor RimP